MNKDTQRRFQPSEIGYFGRGIPDPETMTKLQNAFASKILEHAPVHREKFEKMQELQRKAFAGENVDERALLAAVEIASELLPILHFKVDDVCWDV